MYKIFAVSEYEIETVFYDYDEISDIIFSELSVSSFVFCFVFCLQGMFAFSPIGILPKVLGTDSDGILGNGQKRMLQARERIFK